MIRAEPQPVAGLSAPTLAVWSVVAAFGTYLCMYAFRKPFTAAAFTDMETWGIAEKTLLVTAQVLGYTLSKLLGIRVIAETLPQRRAGMIVALVAAAEVALLAFALVPSPLLPLCMFANSLSLGLVFGLVLGFLEGRQVTEALMAGLCASFILADGMMKSVGTWLLEQGVGERWMPALAGLVFVPPLLFFAWMLKQIPRPALPDVELRSERPMMNRTDRAGLVRRFGPGLFLIVAAYFLVTIARSIRADFAPEIWRGLGVEVVPATFANSEILVALIVLGVSGLSILIIDNRRAFFASLAISLSGGLLMLAAIAGWSRLLLGGFGFMVLAGAGLYLPYVLIQTTVFERLIAMTRERANLGFLMYIADAAGYLGYAGVMIASSALQRSNHVLRFFTVACSVIAVLTCASLALCWRYFARRGESVQSKFLERLPVELDAQTRGIRE